MVTKGAVRFLLVTDTATEIPVMVVCVENAVPGSTEAVVLRRAGWSRFGFIVTDLNALRTCANPEDWTDNTMRAFHHALQQGTDIRVRLLNGDESVDVEAWRMEYAKQGLLR